MTKCKINAHPPPFHQNMFFFFILLEKTIRVYENMLFNSLWKQTNIICLTTKYMYMYANLGNYFKLELFNKMCGITLTN